VKKCVAIANQKGGVGKTTISVNLAFCLALAGFRTLLIDIDPQANATSSLGLKKSRQGGVCRFLETGKYYFEELKQTSHRNLFILPSGYLLRDLEKTLLSQQEAFQNLKNAMASQGDKWDYILIDCPPSLGALTGNAMALAQEILIPIQAEFLALEGLAQMKEALKTIQREINHRIKIGGILLNMFDPEQELSWSVYREVNGFFGKMVFKEVVSRNIILAEAPSYGQAVLEYAPRSTASLEMVEVCREFLVKM
jgi:chromosome partitioning protein